MTARLIINRTVIETASYPITDREARDIESGDVDPIDLVSGSYTDGDADITVNNEEVNWTSLEKG